MLQSCSPLLEITLGKISFAFLAHEVLRVCFRQQLWVPKSCENVVVSCGVMWMRSGQKRGLQKLLPNMWIRDMVKNRLRFFFVKNGFVFALFFCPPKNGRSSGKPPVHHPRFFAHDAKRNSGTTLLLSLQPLFQYFVAQALQS